MGRSIAHAFPLYHQSVKIGWRVSAEVGNLASPISAGDRFGWKPGYRTFRLGLRLRFRLIAFQRRFLRFISLILLLMKYPFKPYLHLLGFLTDAARSFHRGDRAPVEALQRPHIGFTEIDKDLVGATIRDIIKCETASEITLHIYGDILRT